MEPPRGTRVCWASALQIKPVEFTVHAVVTTSDLELVPSELDFGYCTIHEAVRAPVRLCNHSLLPQEFGFVGLPKVPCAWGHGAGSGRSGDRPGICRPSPGGLTPLWTPRPLPGPPASALSPRPSPHPRGPRHLLTLPLSPLLSGPRAAEPQAALRPFPPVPLPAWPFGAAKTRSQPGHPHPSPGCPHRPHRPVTHVQHTDTNTLVHTCTHACSIHADTPHRHETHVCSRACMHTRMCEHSHACTRTQTYLHVYTLACRHTCRQGHTCAHVLHVCR